MPGDLLGNGLLHCLLKYKGSLDWKKGVKTLMTMWKLKYSNPFIRWLSCRLHSHRNQWSLVYRMAIPSPKVLRKEYFSERCVYTSIDSHFLPLPPVAAYDGCFPVTKRQNINIVSQILRNLGKSEILCSFEKQKVYSFLCFLIRVSTYSNSIKQLH